MKTFKLFIVLTVFMTTALSAQWTSNTQENTLVVETSVDDSAAISGTNGNTYVVFWKSVAAPTNYEIRLQILNSDGVPQLGQEGSLITNTLPMSTSTVFWSLEIDANNNIYVGATGTGAGTPAHIYKMDENGSLLWGTDGINLGSGYNVTIAPLSSGEVLVSWLSTSDFKAEMQRLDENGTTLWAASQFIENGANATSPAAMFELSNNDFIAVFHSLLGGINSNLYAQRFNSLGEPQWAQPTQISDKVTRYNRFYNELQDGDIVYVGYTGVSGTRFDSFLQRINPDGSLPWGINGSDFDTNETNYEIDTKIAFTSGSNYIWASCVYTNTSQSQSGLYVQKFDKNTGDRLLSDNAKEVFAIGSENIHAGSLQLKNDSPFILIKSGLDNGVTPTDLLVSHLDENGDFAWPEETRPMATFEANKSRISFTKEVNGQNVAVFIEDKGDGSKIYAQNFFEEILSNGSELSNIELEFVNPVTNNWNLKSSVEIKSIQVYSILGQLIVDRNNLQSLETSISTEKWNSGIYILQITTSKGNLVKQVIKN